MSDVLHIFDKAGVGLTLCGRYALTCSLLTDDIDPDGRFVCAKCAQRGVALRVAERLRAEHGPAYTNADEMAGLERQGASPILERPPMCERITGSTHRCRLPANHDGGCQEIRLRHG